MLLQFEINVSDLNIHLMEFISEFSASLLQSSESHGPSEIIVIC